MSVDELFARPARPLACLLDEVRIAVRRYVVVGPNESIAIALWIAHAWALDAFEATGYLEVRSPVRRCGKTTLLDVLALLAPRPWTTIEPSEAVFYRRIAAAQPTLLLDEVDAIFNRKSETTEGLRACLNAGNRRGTTVPRCQPPKMDIVEFPVFCAKALAGIGGLPATITDRSIPIEMRRKQQGDRVERFRTRKAREETAPLVVELELWADTAVEPLRDELERVERFADEGGPLESLDDRAFEQAWEPLIAVASLAGGDWLADAMQAAVALSGNRDDELDVGVNLLRDIRAVFGDYSERESLATMELLNALLQIEESPWRDWWSDPRSDELKVSKAAPRKLAQTLKPFGITRATIWTPGGVSRKGYRLDGFRDAWARYLPATGGEDGSGRREPSADAGSGLTHAEPEWVRTAVDGRDGSGDSAQPRRSDPPDPSYPPAGEGRNVGEWLARDGVWRPFATDPPSFPGEVVDTRPEPGDAFADFNTYDPEEEMF
jgi:hypothetical protein